MKLATFDVGTPTGRSRRIGAAVDGRLIDFAAGYAAHLNRTDAGCDAERLAAAIFPPDMVLFLGGGDVAMTAARQAIDAALSVDEAFGARTSFATSDVRLLAPIARPRVLRDFSPSKVT